MGLSYLGIPRQARVTEVCTNEVWAMRSRVRRVFGAVYSAIENAQKPDATKGRDVVLRRHNEEDYKDHFSTWDQIRVRARKCLGINLFGSHKEYRAMPSLFGWHSRTHSLREFA